MSTAWKNKAGWYSKYVRMRKPYLAAHPRCGLSIPDICGGKSTQVHHVLGVANAPLDMDYWIAACAPCNQSVGDPTVHDPPHVRTTFWD